MSSLPLEIIENIFSRLPVKSISRFRCVCKYWCNQLFRNPRFIKLHLKHAIQMNNYNLLVTNANLGSKTYLYSVDHNVLSSSQSLSSAQAVGIDYPFMSRNRPQVLGSCDGLICLQAEPDVSSWNDGIWSQGVCIWNPLTREYKQVPETPMEIPVDAEDFATAYGFGYDCEIGDYKLVRIVGFDQGSVSEARVYTLGLDTWRSLGFIPYSTYCGYIPAYLHDGVLYWIRGGCCCTVDKSSIVILSFDICKEKFLDITLPDNYSMDCVSEERPMSDLGVWEGKLCMLHRSNDHVNVWTMKDNTWSNHLSITAKLTDFCLGRPIQNLQNGEILFESRTYEGENVGLISYDPKLERGTVLKIHRFPDEFSLVTYIETLVTLNSGTYVGPTTRGRRKRNQ